MRFGLAGFPGSGKTTLFNAMTGLNVPVGYGGEVRVGTVRVPDPRVDFLSRVIAPKKTTYATINLRDVPGEYGAGAKVLSSRSLHEIRDREALCLVLRDFLNPALEGDPDPLGDLRAFHEECVLADLGVVERRLDRARKERADVREIDAFETCAAALEEGRAIRLLPAVELHRGFVKGYGLLTDMPLLTAVNVGEDRAGEELPGAGRRGGSDGGCRNGSLGQRGGRNCHVGARRPGRVSGGHGTVRTDPRAIHPHRVQPHGPDLVLHDRQGGCSRLDHPAGHGGARGGRGRFTATWSAASSAPRSSRMRCSPSTGPSRP